MNRIELEFVIDPHKGNSIRIDNDIKGLTYYCIGGKKIKSSGINFDDGATDLFMLLTNVDYTKLDNYMSYGVRVIYKGKYNDDILKEEYYKKLLDYCANRGYKIEFLNEGGEE